MVWSIEYWTPVDYLYNSFAPKLGQWDRILNLGSILKFLAPAPIIQNHLNSGLHKA